MCRKVVVAVISMSRFRYILCGFMVLCIDGRFLSHLFQISIARFVVLITKVVSLSPVVAHTRTHDTHIITSKHVWRYLLPNRVDGRCSRFSFFRFFFSLFMFDLIDCIQGTKSSDDPHWHMTHRVNRFNQLFFERKISSASVCVRPIISSMTIESLRKSLCPSEMNFDFYGPSNAAILLAPIRMSNHYAQPQRSCYAFAR